MFKIMFVLYSQFGSFSLYGKVRSKARICLRFFQVLFFLPAAAPPIPECYHDRVEIQWWKLIKQHK